MKRFVLHIVLFILLLSGVLLIALLFIPNNKIPDNSLFASYDKHQRLSSITEPKIILVGGSNLPFGVKSKMLEDSLGMPVVNMGLHAGLGMNFILSEVEKDIHQGDVVVVSLEYHHYLSSSMYNGEDVLAALLFDVNRDCMKYVSAKQWIALIPNLCLYSTKKLISFSSKPVNDFEDKFTRESFNEYGDEVAHYGMVSTIRSKDEPALKSKVQKKSLRRLIQFKKSVEAKGAKFCLEPCPYPQQQFKADEKSIRAVADELRETGIPFPVDPELYAYPDSLMFNSYFHLGEYGADMRTESLISILKNSL